MQNRMRYFCVIGDIKKEIVRIRISKRDRDALRILSYGGWNLRKLKKHHFTRAIFGAGSSPYILNDTIEKHVTPSSPIYPDTTKHFSWTDMTDMMTFKMGGDSVQELGTFKNEVSIIMNEGRITLHKWQSNVEPLECQADPRESHKAIVLIQPNRCPKVTDPLTKRKIPSALNGIYDLLGWASP